MVAVYVELVGAGKLIVGVTGSVFAEEPALLAKTFSA